MVDLVCHFGFETPGEGRNRIVARIIVVSNVWCGVRSHSRLRVMIQITCDDVIAVGLLFFVFEYLHAQD